MNDIKTSKKRTMVRAAPGWRVMGAVGLLLIGMCGVAHAKRVSPVSWGVYGQHYAEDGAALAGFDPVSYFDGAPLAGSTEHDLTWGGATWRFASADNRARFEASPDRFAPQFGGFCSFAVSKGFTASIDPNAYVVRGGKLYLFNSADIKNDWLSDVDSGIIEDAEQSWEKR